MLFYFSQLITSEASTICPTCILSWLSFTILNLPLPTCWIWARNTLSEPWTIHHTGTPSLDCLCCFLPNKILSADAQAIYCLLYYNNFCFQVLSKGCEKHWYYVCYNSSKWQYSLVHFRNWVNSMNLWYSIGIFEEFKKYNILPADELLW